MANPNAFLLKDPHLTRSPGETRAFASQWSHSLDANSVLSLNGDLGAGKTEFVKGLAEGLGFPGEVTSPTFAIAHEYPGGRIPIFHFDFYRMEDPGELLTAGFDECLGCGLVVAEWGGRFPEFLPAGTWHVNIRTDENEPGHRWIEVRRQ